MSKWRYIDEWSDDDPAIRRLRDSLARRLADTPGRLDDALLTADSSADAVASLDRASRRERIALLVRRIEAGDMSAVEPLRGLLAATYDRVGR